MDSIGTCVAKREQRIPSEQEVKLLSEFLQNRDQKSYGYQLSKKLEIPYGTLYKHLANFTKENYLTQEPDNSSGKERKYYQLTEKGVAYAEKRLRLAEFERNIDVYRGQAFTADTG